jgi:hypothetical protein
VFSGASLYPHNVVSKSVLFSLDGGGGGGSAFGSAGAQRGGSLVQAQKSKVGRVPF